MSRRRPSPARNLWTLASAALGAICVLPSLATAQLEGIVRDPTWRGIPAVTVTLWRETDEIARTTSDAAGRFRFSNNVVEGATALVARRIGLRPATASIAAGLTSITLTMEPIATSLPVQTRTAVAKLCPNTGTATAQDLWQAVRRRYVIPDPRDGIAMTMWTRREQVRAALVGEVDDGRLQEGAFTIYGIAREGRVRSLVQDGYARRLPEPSPGVQNTDGLFLRWRYASLWSELVGHFVEPSFGQQHSLSLAPIPDGSALIVFCGKGAQQTRLEGTLEVSADSALLRATWRYVTPDTDEDAAAEVTFVPPAPGANAVPLVPVRSVFWRRLGGQRDFFYQDATVYRSWKTAPYCAPETPKVGPCQ